MADNADILAYDISSYQGMPPASWFRTMRLEGGFNMGIAQAWGGKPGAWGFNVGPNPYAEYQLASMRVSGCVTGAYVWVPSDEGTPETESIIRSAVNAIGAEKHTISHFWIDIEGSSRLYQSPYSRLLNAYNWLRNLLPSTVKIGVYTSAYQWSRVMQGINLMGTVFPTLPLWDAHYTAPSGQDGGKPSSLDWNWLPYGGWSQRAMIQYAGTVPQFGVGADLNIGSRLRLGLPTGVPGGGGPPGGDDDMFNEEDRRILTLAQLQAQNVDLETDSMLREFPAVRDWVAAIVTMVPQLFTKVDSLQAGLNALNTTVAKLLPIPLTPAERDAIIKLDLDATTAGFEDWTLVQRSALVSGTKKLLRL